VIYIPDVVELRAPFEIGCACVLGVRGCGCLRRGVRAFVDISLSAAAGGVSLGDYLRLVRRAVRVGGEAYAVVPDAFCRVAETIRSYERLSRFVRGAGARAVLVLHRFYTPALYRYLEAYRRLDVDAVALPMRRHCDDVVCHREPRLCAERASRALLALRDLGVWVHLLGPPAGVLRRLSLEDVHSINASGYRVSPRPMMNGGGGAAPRFAQWLRAAGLL